MIAGVFLDLGTMVRLMDATETLTKLIDSTMGRMDAILEAHPSLWEEVRESQTKWGKQTYYRAPPASAKK